MIEAVIVHIIEGDRILLHYKKRGHGAGKWNGLGGKIRKGETPEECAQREAEEEMGAEVADLQKMGEIMFYDVRGEDWFVHVFRAKIIGKPKESEESRPKWFSLNSIPYNEMWEDDRYWLPLVINNLKFRAKFWFSGETMEKFSIDAWKDLRKD